MFEKHIEAYYYFLAKRPLLQKFSVVKNHRKLIYMYQFSKQSWVLIPDNFNDIKEEEVKTYVRSNPQKIRFIDKRDFKDIKNKELCRKLTTDDQILFDEFHKSCSKLDKEEGMVSLEDPVVYGCIVDKKIVSVVSLLNWGERLSDIGILTHPDYRYKGYAKSVCETLMSENDKLYVWRCGFDNTGSNILADSIGFTEAGESFTLSKKVIL